MRSGEQDVEGNVGEVLSGRVERASQRVNGEGDMEELTEIAKTGVASVQARSQDIDTKVRAVWCRLHVFRDAHKLKYSHSLLCMFEDCYRGMHEEASIDICMVLLLILVCAGCNPVEGTDSGLKSVTHW